MYEHHSHRSSTRFRPGFLGVPFSVVPYVLALGLVSFAAGCKTDPGRCGINELCDPVVRVDPFPNDQCVPPKGVDPCHFGYTAPQWKVLASRESNCCAPGVVLPCGEELVVDPEQGFPELIGSPEAQNAVSPEITEWATP